MNALTRLALEIQTLCEAEGWPHCFIGGFAVQHWGEARYTGDVDLTVLTGFGGEEPFVERLIQKFEPRVPEPVEFALRNRVVLLRSAEGIGIDVALGALPFEESAVRRAQKIEVETGAFVRLCSPEDLIVMKAFADRPLDWNDVRGILIRQGVGVLDWGYIRVQLAPLCELKETPEILSRLEALADELRED